MSTSQHITKKQKCCHKTLTIEDKISLLDYLPTCSYSDLCKRYGVEHSTISDLKKKEPELHQFKKKITDLGAKR